jgi:hypothetical protein
LESTTENDYGLITLCATTEINDEKYMMEAGCPNSGHDPISK